MTLDGDMNVHIGPYRIVQKIGVGGMGEVYEAFHDTIQRRVAVKILHAEMAGDPEFSSRFLNEARAVNLINHPGLVQVSDLGQLPDGSVYLIMELLRGETLSSRLKRSQGRLALPAVLEFGWQVADSLAAAHDKHIFHRDLKPQNIMLVPDSHVNLGERAKLLDFGLAKVSEQAGGVHVRTRADRLMGTPLYMSPEQCAGTGGLDDKTDVYSLGVILYEMLCGELPFTGRGAGLLMAMHITQPPEPLQQRMPAIPKEVADLVHRMLAKPKYQRPTMLEVAAELDILRTLYFPAQSRRSFESVGSLHSFASGSHQNSTLPAAAAELAARVPRGRLMAACVLGMLFGVLGVILLMDERKAETTAAPLSSYPADLLASSLGVPPREEEEPSPQPLRSPADLNGGNPTSAQRRRSSPGGRGAASAGKHADAGLSSSHRSHSGGPRSYRSREPKVQ